MDAVAILENLGLQVKLNGSGKIKKQSIQKGEKVKPNQQILISSIDRDPIFGLLLKVLIF